MASTGELEHIDRYALFCPAVMHIDQEPLVLQKAGVLAAGVFTAAEWIDPKDTEQVLDTAAPD